MKKMISLFAALLLALALHAQGLSDRIAAFSDVVSVEPLENTVFAEKYLVRMKQPVDPSDPSKGYFNQRVIVCHAGYDRPTVLVTEGYWADYALRPNYQEELSRLYNTNIICVEYRYFGQSMPDPVDWDHLTVVNSLKDLHKVNQTFKQIYKGKWISTGISKGGQTTMFYRAYYPEDVDISVPYVAPLNKKLEDGRHEPFLSKKVGTPEARKAIKDCQMEILRRRATIQPMFEEFCKSKKYVFRVPMDEAYDLTVMEISFAIWQWGVPVENIPATTASDKELFNFLIDQCDPYYFAESTPYYSFNVMAARDLGYYGYDIRPFRKYASVKSTRDYLRRVMLAPSESKIEFDPSVYRHTVDFLKKNDPKMVYIYGGIDPWGASGVCTWLNTSKKDNLRWYVKDGGSHSTRIGSFDEPVRSEIISRIQKWLDE